LVLEEKVRKAGYGSYQHRQEEIPLENTSDVEPCQETPDVDHRFLHPLEVATIYSISQNIAIVNLFYQNAP
jgi:hypothetical protein